MRLNKQTIQENFSRAASRYDAHASLQKQWRMRVMAHGIALFPDKADLLDVGCGTGAFTAEAREIQPGWNITGVDIAPGMCRVAAQQGKVIEADAANMPMPDAAYDGVVSSLCLQWLGDLTKAFHEMQRVLRPGGYGVVMTLASSTLQELRALAPQLRLLPMKSVEEYCALAHCAGFEVVACDAPVERYSYPSISALLRSFRQIGANAAFEGPMHRMKPSEYRTLADNYRAKHAAGEGVAASWQPLLLILRKPL